MNSPEYTQASLCLALTQTVRSPDLHFRASKTHSKTPTRTQKLQKREPKKHRKNGQKWSQNVTQKNDQFLKKSERKVVGGWVVGVCLTTHPTPHPGGMSEPA